MTGVCEAAYILCIYVCVMLHGQINIQVCICTIIQNFALVNNQMSVLPNRGPLGINLCVRI